MENCICEICKCGAHQCPHKFPKDIIRLNLTKMSLPMSETREVFQGHPVQQRPPLCIPVDYDWNVHWQDDKNPKPVPYIKMPEYDDYFEEAPEPSYMVRSMSRQKPQKTTIKQLPDSDPWGRQVKLGLKRFDIEPATGVSITKTDFVHKEPEYLPKDEPEEPVVVQPFKGLTTYNHHFPVQPLIGRDEPCIPENRKPFVVADTPWEYKTQSMIDFPKGRNDNPKMRSPIMPRPLIKNPTGLMEQKTVYRDVFCAPYVDMKPLQEEFQQLLSLGDDPPVENMNEHKHGSKEDEKFAMDVLYRTHNMDQFGPPSSYNYTYPVKLSPEEATHIFRSDHKKVTECPAAPLLDQENGPPQNYKYCETVCGHEYFKKRQ